jgi:hypothetical protein
MTLPEQSAILLEAIKDELLQPEDVVRWADAVIVATEKPPQWVIELSTLHSPHLADFVSRLRQQASAALTVHRQLQLIVLAYDAGLFSLPTTLSKLFRVAILDREEPALDALGQRLVDTLIEWDCQEDLDVIEQPLQAKFTALFREYLTDADDIAAVLPWKFERAA